MPTIAGDDLRFAMLGPLEAHRGNRRLALGGPRQRSLLALLLIHANTPVSADRLITELWGEDCSTQAVNALHVQVSRLRRRLAEPTGAASEPALVTGPFGYLLSVSPQHLDADRFERLLGEGRSALDSGSPQNAAARLREALALWRGPALADLEHESFAQGAIGRLEELRLAALEARIDADLALGRHGDLVTELDRLVAQHPLREYPHGQLMLALYRCGRQADALAVYRRARERLAAELGLEPSPGLRGLERAILQHDASIQPPSRMGVDAPRRRAKRGPWRFAARGAELRAGPVAAAVSTSSAYATTPLWYVRPAPGV
jgi:DNA-binding SARP family transcriptional activator